MLTHFSLFTGIGGIDLAAEWAGFESVGQCEWADYPTKVLEKHWPDVPRWRDVRDVTNESIRKRGIKEITLLSGGFPCQPHSVAGKRQASADERDLWGEFARVICEVRPKWVLAENVPGLLSSEDGRFFGRVLRNLGEMGYNVGWCMYGADTVGAVHKRERVFLVSYSNDTRHATQKDGDKEWAKGIKDGKHPQFKYSGLHKNVTNPGSEHVERSSKDEVLGREELQSFIHARSIEEWRERSAIYQPKLCRTYNGIPGQVDRLKCLGNAVVPQQVYPILQAIADVERSQEETG